MLIYLLLFIFKLEVLKDVVGWGLGGVLVDDQSTMYYSLTSLINYWL